MGKQNKLKMGTLLKMHPLADSPIQINPISQKTLENIDDTQLIGLVGDNLYNFMVITCREKALQTELRRRKRAIPPHFVKYIAGCVNEQVIADEDLFSLKEEKNTEG